MLVDQMPVCTDLENYQEATYILVLQLEEKKKTGIVTDGIYAV